MNELLGALEGIAFERRRPWMHLPEGELAFVVVVVLLVLLLLLLLGIRFVIAYAVVFTRKVSDFPCYYNTRIVVSTIFFMTFCCPKW